MAAVLACAPGAFVSHATAGALWKLVPPTSPSAPIIVTVVGRVVRQPRIDVRRTQKIHPVDRRSLKSIPITSPVRTIIDMAPVLTRCELEQVCAVAKRRNLVSRNKLEAAIERNRGRPGVAPVSALLTTVDPAYTRSEAERRMLDLIRAAGLPEPLTNACLGDYEPGFYWPEHQLIVEVDGYDFHPDPAAFERDRRRDAEFLAIGIRTTRTTWKQLTTDTTGVTTRLQAVLSIPLLG
jgi:very-short-patch-repair endonuclease